MRCGTFLLVVAAAGASISCQPQSRYDVWPQWIAKETAMALGGTKWIHALDTLELEGEARGDLLIDEPSDASTEPNTPSNRSGFIGEQPLRYSLSVDLATHDWSAGYIREPTQMRAALRRVFGVRGGIAYDTGPGGRASSPSDEIRRFLRTAWYHHPVPIIRAALEDAKQCCGRTFHERMFEIEIDPAVRTTLTVERSGLIWIITSDDRSGRFRVSTAFEDYRNVDGLNLPFRIKTTFTTTFLGTPRQSGDMELLVEAYHLNFGTSERPSVPFK